MLSIGDFSISGEIVLALMVSVIWIASSIAAICTKDSEILGGALFATILIGIGYFLMCGIS